MSRVGKKIILIPDGVDVTIEGRNIKVKGPKGEISYEVRPEVAVNIEDGKILVSAKADNRKIGALWGLTRNLLANMIIGVTTGFEKKLSIEGVGFRAAVEGDSLVLHVGFTNPVRLKISPEIKIGVEKNIISVSGIKKDLVGQTAAVIRKSKPPEPYKGKGIRYFGEQIKKKLGKKAITSGGK